MERSVVVVEISCLYLELRDSHYLKTLSITEGKKKGKDACSNVNNFNYLLQIIIYNMWSSRVLLIDE